VQGQGRRRHRMGGLCTPLGSGACPPMPLRALPPACYALVHGLGDGDQLRAGRPPCVRQR
jgi:hypothetical protein